MIQAANTLSDERTEFLINDRLSFMRFLGLSLSDRVPDARTIWLFREKLTRAEAIKPLFDRFDAALREAGYVAMGGQIVDASLIAAPKQRNTEEEKKAVKEGRIPQAWKAQPAKLRQKDRDARWTVKFSKAKARPDGTVPPVDIAIPTFGYQNHVSIDREHGLIRRWEATDAAAYEGARLREGLLDKTNTASPVWADTAYRSKANEAFLEKNGFVSRVHRKKPAGRPMPETTRRANALKSKVRSGVEHVFAVQKDKMDLFVRTIGIAGRKPRSAWPTSSTTSAGSSSSIVSLPPDPRAKGPPGRRSMRRPMPHPKPRSRTSKSRHSTRLRPEKRVYRTVQFFEPAPHSKTLLSQLGGDSDGHQKSERRHRRAGSNGGAGQLGGAAEPLPSPRRPRAPAALVNPSTTTAMASRPTPTAG